MHITPIQARVFNPTTNSKKTMPVTKDIPTSDKYTKSIYEKGSSVYFTGGENLVNKFVYQKLLRKHIRAAMEPGLPKAVENYFASLGIPANFSRGSKKMNQVVAYGSFHTNEMFRQLNLVLPRKIGIESMGDSSILACHYPAPNPHGGGSPARTIVYNLDYDWENHMEKSLNTDPSNSYEHFMQCFIHEYAHNLHAHKLYKKYGSFFPDPAYKFNPATESLMNKLRRKINDKNGNPVYNPHILDGIRIILSRTTSKYGQTSLMETFAEEFARIILDCMDYNTLRLKSRPNPKNIDADLTRILEETWEGLIGDKWGLIM